MTARAQGDGGQGVDDRDTRVEALRWVNDRRAALRLSPVDALPAGTPCSPGRCPLALAVGSGPIGPIHDHEGRPLPPAVRRFLAEFDLGLHPDLVAVERDDDVC